MTVLDAVSHPPEARPARPTRRGKCCPGRASSLLQNSSRAPAPAGLTTSAPAAKGGVRRKRGARGSEGSVASASKPQGAWAPPELPRTRPTVKPETATPSWLPRGGEDGGGAEGGGGGYRRGANGGRKRNALRK